MLDNSLGYTIIIHLKEHKIAGNGPKQNVSLKVKSKMAAKLLQNTIKLY